MRRGGGSGRGCVEEEQAYPVFCGVGVVRRISVSVPGSRVGTGRDSDGRRRAGGVEACWDDPL